MNHYLSQIDFTTLNSQIQVQQKDVGSFLSKASGYFFSIAGIYFLYNVVSSGFTLLTSAGDPKKIGAAKGRLTQSVIGLLVIAFSFVIVKLIAEVFSLTDLTNLF